MDSFIRGVVFLVGFFGVIGLLKNGTSTALFDQSTLYIKMGGGYVLGLAGIAVLFAVIGFAVSAGWRLGKRLEK